MIDMPDLLTPLLFALFISVLLALGFFWSSSCKTDTINELRREAVKRGYAVWAIDDDNSSVVFKWKD